MDKTVVVPVDKLTYADCYRFGLDINEIRGLIAAAPAPAAQDEREAEAGCLLCANGNDLPDGEWCRSCGCSKESPLKRAVRIARGEPDVVRTIKAYNTALTAPQDAQERNAIIEECAKVCDEQATEPECPERAKYCAEAIRALKTAQPADKPEGKAEQQAEPVATRWAIYFDNLNDSEMRSGFVTNWKLYESEDAAKSAITQTCRLEQRHYYSARKVYIYTAPAQPQQWTAEEIYEFARRNGYVDRFSDFQDHDLLREEIIKFGRDLLAAQGGKDKSAAPGQDGNISRRSGGK